MNVKKWIRMLLVICTGIVLIPASARAGKITSLRQAEKKALKKVKNARVTELDEDYEKGVHVYEVQLRKGMKEYDLVYRSSDGKLLSYGWDQKKRNRTSKKAIMSKSACKKLAKKEVKKGKITSIKKKRDDGVWVWKVKLSTKDKKYTLEYHARTCALLEYEWDLITKKSKKSSKNNGYIGHEKVRKIALQKVPGADIIKVEFEKDDGVPVYKVEMIKGDYEYEVEIHAKTGKILDFEKDYWD